MKIKEAANLCGLTEKAIRLYEAKGLIQPVITVNKQNGRSFRDYDETTVERLQIIARLRRAFFFTRPDCADSRCAGSGTGGL